ncbi:MAG TPA: DUF1993 domain-containing protein [Candidatus Paceibacterota bacterium]
MTNIYETTAPLFRTMLVNLSAILDKAVAFADERKIEESALLNDRLAPDMFPLVRQVQIACDNAKGALARLAGVEVPKHEDTETTFRELKERIAKTLAFLNTLEEARFAGASGRRIELPYVKWKHLTGEDYVRSYAIPNFLFHVTIAYGILRHNGVPVGKVDFLGTLPWIDD